MPMESRPRATTRANKTALINSGMQPNSFVRNHLTQIGRFIPRPFVWLLDSWRFVLIIDEFQQIPETQGSNDEQLSSSSTGTQQLTSATDSEDDSILNLLPR